MNSPAEDSAASRPNEWILVVDDEVEIGIFLTRGIGTDRLKVICVEDGPSALRMLAERATDPLLIIADVLLPGGTDGLTLVRKLLTRLRRTKIVLMSGHLSADSFWPTDLREVTFLAKPFRLAQVVELVEAARVEFRG